MRVRDGTARRLRRAVHGATQARTKARQGGRPLSFQADPAFEEVKTIVMLHFSSAC